jgi:hypothetical protein
MNPKPRPNHKRYLEILRRMTPAQRLQKSFELTELANRRLKEYLQRHHAQQSEQQIQSLYLETRMRLNRRKSRRECQIAARMP